MGYKFYRLLLAVLKLFYVYLKPLIDKALLERFFFNYVLDKSVMNSR